MKETKRNDRAIAEINQIAHRKYVDDEDESDETNALRRAEIEREAIASRGSKSSSFLEVGVADNPLAAAGMNLGAGMESGMAAAMQAGMASVAGAKASGGSNATIDVFSPGGWLVAPSLEGPFSAVPKPICATKQRAS